MSAETVFGWTLEEHEARARSMVCWRCDGGWVEHVVCGWGRLCDDCYQRLRAVFRMLDDDPADLRSDVPEVGTCRCVS